MSKPTKATVVPIDPEGKYVLLIDFEFLDDKQRVAIKGKFMDDFRRWWESDAPLYVIATFGGTLVLQRVDEEEPE